MLILATLAGLTLAAADPVPAGKCAVNEAATSQPDATVRFEYLNHAIYVQPTIGGKMARWFLLDTGSGAVVVDRRVARKLRLHVVDTATVEGTVGSQRAEIVAIDTLGIGCYRQPDIFAASADLSGMPAPEGAQLAGVIGYDVLQALSVRIDYNLRQLTFSASAAPADAGNVSRVAFVIDGSSPRVDALVDGRVPASLRLDTGLTSTGDDAYVAASASMWSSLGPSPVNDRVDAHGIGGRSSLDAMRARQLSIGTAVVSAPWLLRQDATGYFARTDAVSLVGNSFLERFSPVTIDYISSALYLASPAELALEAAPER